MYLKPNIEPVLGETTVCAFSFQTHVAKTKVGCLDRFSPGPKKPDIVSTGS
jgi:hypothetical protein